MAKDVLTHNIAQTDYAVLQYKVPFGDGEPYLHFALKPRARAEGVFPPQLFGLLVRFVIEPLNSFTMLEVQNGDFIVLNARAVQEKPNLQKRIAIRMQEAFSGSFDLSKLPPHTAT